jgi:hypothetical protein
MDRKHPVLLVRPHQARSSGVRRYNRKTEELVMPVFHCDRDGSCKLAQDAMHKLRNTANSPGATLWFSRGALPQGQFDLTGAAALMMGITPDLQESLQSATGQGMTAFVAPNDQLAFRYVRVKDGQTVSLISVAPVRTYWGGQTNAKAAQWKELCPPIDGAVLLQTLKDSIVTIAKGQPADFEF